MLSNAVLSNAVLSNAVGPGRPAGPHSVAQNRLVTAISRPIRGWIGLPEDRRAGLRVSARPYRP
ncbi:MULTISPECIES: hypothetical protein [unclassified Kitasatospora]|uniref:hypothetical protein n=1 Tax=unclassified Kitasatospora TaxID=2633591 RepID=UPI0035157985